MTTQLCNTCTYWCEDPQRPTAPERWCYALFHRTHGAFTCRNYRSPRERFDPATDTPWPALNTPPLHKEAGP